ncbi:MAG: hypothetical protein LBG21_06255 [Campylobacteraceae bacterium]|jgi:hypothetical protein|nr:hypothetical protein [Campylobacteraceae bacterium]
MKEVVLVENGTLYLVPLGWEKFYFQKRQELGFISFRTFSAENGLESFEFVEPKTIFKLSYCDLHVYEKGQIDPSRWYWDGYNIRNGYHLVKGAVTCRDLQSLERKIKKEDDAHSEPLYKFG